MPPTTPTPDEIAGLMDERYGPNPHHRTIAQDLASDWRTDALADAFQTFFTAELVARSRK